MGLSEDITDLRRWLPEASLWATRNVGSDLPLGVGRAKWEEERSDQKQQPPAAEMLENIQSHVEQRDDSYHEDAGRRLAYELGRFASQVPGLTAPELRRGESAGLSFLEYIAVAVETGDAPAIDAIEEWMRRHAKPGPKGEDWPTVLRTYRYVARAIQTFRAGSNTEAADQPLLERFSRAGIDLMTITADQTSREI